MIGSIVYPYSLTPLPPTYSLHTSDVPRSSYSTLSSALIEIPNVSPHLHPTLEFERVPTSPSDAQSLASTSTNFPHLFDRGDRTLDDHGREVDKRFLSNYFKYVPSRKKTYYPLNVLILPVTQLGPIFPMQPT
ncbi:hypothetical protein NLI96_g6768 [Meripilus lineatus]|uniref:Uncharacterized protein n=1 Tax=Meripilus lineatus TaxID=2056292 RepID=A0AAD5YHV2_9APHY|nr:hypothetical protein NLI96_g6768 [Physisporinus lineatus]